tara:strand:- start:3257 stop:3760 length:504 start_codon:yes stop_codon:yes gene_type:complete
MKFLKIAILLLVFPLLTASTPHKFYVSITKIEYVAESESLQIINQMFIDDIEDVLQLRYNPKVSLATKKETDADATFLKEYILQKLQIKVNGMPVEYDYLGKEYDIDEVKSYIEITGVKNFKSIEVENKALMEMFPDQQNIIHVKTKKSRRSMILTIDNPKGVLNFD